MTSALRSFLLGLCQGLCFGRISLDHLLLSFTCLLHKECEIDHIMHYLSVEMRVWYWCVLNPSLSASCNTVDYSICRVVISKGWGLVCQLKITANRLGCNNQMTLSEVPSCTALDPVGDQLFWGVEPGRIRIMSLLIYSVTFYVDFEKEMMTSFLCFAIRTAFSSYSDCKIPEKLK